MDVGALVECLTSGLDAEIIEAALDDLERAFAGARPESNEATRAQVLRSLNLRAR